MASVSSAVMDDDQWEIGEPLPPIPPKSEGMFHASFCEDHFLNPPFGAAFDESRFRYGKRGEFCSVAGCNGPSYLTERKWPPGMLVEHWRKIPYRYRFEELIDSLPGSETHGSD